MAATPLTELLAKHAEGLSAQSLQDLLLNPRTPSFRRMDRAEILERVGALYHGLAYWLDKHDDDAVRAAFEDWGRKRFKQAIPLSEIAYCVILAKQHLNRLSREHGLTEEPVAVGDFFDRALYYLVRGWEMQGATPPDAGRESGPIAHPR
jgi:hypothetical protein